MAQSAGLLWPNPPKWAFLADVRMPKWAFMAELHKANAARGSNYKPSSCFESRCDSVVRVPNPSMHGSCVKNWGTCGRIRTMRPIPGSFSGKKI